MTDESQNNSSDSAAGKSTEGEPAAEGTATLLGAASDDAAQGDGGSADGGGDGGEGAAGAADSGEGSGDGAGKADGEGEGEGAAGEGKEGDGGSDEGPPETYELKPAEGQEFNPALLTKFEEHARANGMTNEQAQTMLTDLAATQAANTKDAIDGIHTQWREEFQADKALGGDNLKQTLADAAAFVKAFGSTELPALLERTGLGNNIHVVGAFAHAARAIGPDRLVAGTTSETTEPKDPAKVMFPTMK